MSDPYGGIGRGLSDFGAGVAQFIEKNKIRKSRLALEREKQAKVTDVIDRKAGFLKQQLSPDDTDLYTLLTDQKPKTIEEFSLLEPEIENRIKMRSEKAKEAAAAQKELDAQTKAEEKLKRKSEILQKQLDMNQEMPQEVKGRVMTFLDGTEEGYEAARDEFRAWKPEKVDKVTLAEEKAALTEEIWALAGDEDFNTGMERLKQTDKQKFIRASSLGIKPDKGDEKKDPAASYIEQIQRDFTTAKKAGEAEDLKSFAVTWMEDRKEFIPEEARTAIMGRLYPERTSLGSTGTKDPDAQRADELSDKLRSTPDQMTDEEMDWLEQYRKKSQSAGN